MRPLILAMTVVAGTLACPLVLGGEPVCWKKRDGGNNHYYQVVLVGRAVSWEEAFWLARRQGGYLATITSRKENNFVISLLRDLAYWTNPGSGGGIYRATGPWIGAFQVPGSPEPDEGWFWLTGEPVQFPGHWCDGEPNDYYGPDRNENCMNYFYIGTEPLDVETFTPGWNDSPNDGWPGPIMAYIIEWDKNPKAFKRGNR